MSYDPRTIAFVGEILFPPMQLRADLVQGVHNALFKQPSLCYQSFQVAADGIHLSNMQQTPGQISMASFKPDRLVVREELRGTTVEDFATRLVNVSTTAFESLGIGASLGQQFCIRSLITPKQCRNGIELLTERLLDGGNHTLSQFGRPAQSVGLRLAFPPVAEHRAAYQVRVESWPQDPRSIWIEVTGTFAGTVPAKELPQVAEHLYTSYKFLTGPVSEFVANYDRL